MNDHRRLSVLFATLCPVLMTVNVASAGTVTALYQFPGGAAGSLPFSGVVQDKAGTLYGETWQGGTTDCVTLDPSVGCGTLFSFSRTSGLKTLVTFNGSNGAVGQNTPLLVGSTLYGTTGAGGAHDMGVVFSVHTDGTGFKLLHEFSGLDGIQPRGSLAVGPNGVLYGAAIGGGPYYPAKGYGYGTLYQVTPDGTFTVLHNFTNGADGSEPTSVAVAKNGDVIGGTWLGGAYKRGQCIYEGCGTLYQYTPTTATFTVVQTFNGDNGASPVVGSVTKNGTVLGTSGNAFTYSLTKGYTMLPVTSGAEEAEYREVPPILTPGPSLTGVSPDGAYGGYGTLYQQIGTILTVLHYFDGPEGVSPDGNIVIGAPGTIIGTAGRGGAACDCGTIWEYVP